MTGNTVRHVAINNSKRLTQTNLAFASHIKKKGINLTNQSHLFLCFEIHRQWNIIDIFIPLKLLKK